MTNAELGYCVVELNETGGKKRGLLEGSRKKDCKKGGTYVKKNWPEKNQELTITCPGRNEAVRAKITPASPITGDCLWMTYNPHEGGVNWRRVSAVALLLLLTIGAGLLLYHHHKTTAGLGE